MRTIRVLKLRLGIPKTTKQSSVTISTHLREFRSREIVHRQRRIADAARVRSANNTISPRACAVKSHRGADFHTPAGSAP